jgi:hypothetical protein
MTIGIFSHLAKAAARQWPPVPTPGWSAPPPMPPPPEPFLVGLDFGQASELTALAVAEQVKREDGLREYSFRHLHRWPLATPYTSPEGGPNGIIEYVAELLEALPRKAILVVDATACGRSVIDMVCRAHLPVNKLISVNIAGGHLVTSGGGYRNVPKKDLVGVVQTCLQGRRLKVAPDLREAKELIRELQTFKVKVSLATGNETLEAWRERDHDDLVLAVALAVWAGETMQRKLVMWA